MGLFDVHAHLTSSRFAADLPDVLSRAAQAGVTTIISNGLNLEDNRRVLQLAQKTPLVRPALGLYPVDAVLTEMQAAGVDYPREDASSATPEATVEFIANHLSEAVAIGEIGLDHHWVPEPFWARQEALFLQLVDLAQEAKLPIIIHTRKAERRAFELLLTRGPVRVNWHCFSSRLSLGRQIADAGHYLSIPANARRNETFLGLLRGAARERLLLETDCPYLGPVPGERSEPSNVAATVELAAEVWKCSVLSAQQTFEHNFERLFGFAP